MFGEIRNRQGEKIDYSYHPGSDGAESIVVIGHGVTGNKDRPFIVALAEGLASAGIPALRISFAGNGNSEGRFTDAIVSKEAEDLGAVIDALDGRAVCYAGHSMGGAVGVLRASTDDRIRFLVSLAGMVHTRQFAETEFGMVKLGEGCMWEEPECPLSQAYMDDMRAIDTLVDKGPLIKVPWLLVHGTEDDVVPIQDSRDIFARANEPKELVEIPGSNHVFADAHTPVMVDTVLKWAKARLLCP